MWVCFCFPPLGPHLGGFFFGAFCLLEVLWYLTSQWPILSTWLTWGVLGRASEVYARCMGLNAVPTWILVLGFNVSVAVILGETEVIGSICWQHWQFWIQKPIGIKDVYAMAMCSPACFEHLGCYNFEVKSMRNFWTSSLFRGHGLDGISMFCTFSSSVGKLHLLTVRALRQSTNLSWNPPTSICTSSNWYIWHHRDTVWSIWAAKWSRKDFGHFLSSCNIICGHTGRMSPGSISGDQWYQENVVYTPGAVPLSSCSSGIAWRWEPVLHVDSQNSLNSSCWLDVIPFKGGCF